MNKCIMFTGDGRKYDISFLSAEFSIRLGIGLNVLQRDLRV